MKKYFTLLFVLVLMFNCLPAQAIKITTPNLALNKPASADSYYTAGYEARNAFDGDPNTYWAKGYSGRSAHLQVDLEEAQLISKIIMYFRTDMNNTTGRRSFEIQLSNSSDFKEYETVYAQGSDALPFGQPLMFDVSTKKAYRYVRYQKTKDEDAVINEIMVYGAEEQPKDYSALDETKYEKAVRLLDYLGIIDFDTFAFDEPVTRAEATATLVNTVSNVTGFVAEDYRFNDVSEESEYFNAIMHGCAAGIISKPNDRLFRPNDYVTTTEMCKMMLCALNYKIVYEQYGGYPEAIKKLSDELKLLKGSNAAYNDFLVRSDMAILLYNMLSTETFEFSTVNAKNGYVQGDKLLKKLYNLEEQRGIVDGTYLTELVQKGAVPVGYVKINNVKYRDTTKMMKDYLGYSMDYFVDADTKSTIAVFSPTDKNSFITIDGQNLIVDSKEFKNGTISSRIDNKTKKYHLQKGFSVIYNGVADNDFTVSSLENKKYNTTITLLDNDDNGQYDIMLVNVRQSVIVRSANIQEDVYTVIGEDSTVIKGKNDAESVKVRNTAGMYMRIDGIEPGDVVTAEVSKDGTVSDIILGYSLMSGTINSVRNDGAVKVEIDGKEYIVDDFYSRALKAGSIYASELRAGLAGTFRLDYMGNIIGTDGKMVSSNTSYGVIMRIFWTNDENGNDTILAKTLTEKSTIENYYINKTFKLDDKSEKLNKYEQSKTLPISTGVYKLTVTDGKINEIETLDEHDGGGLHYKALLSCLYKINYKMELRISGSEPLFYVPVDTDGNIVLDEELAKKTSLSAKLVDETSAGLNKYYDYDRETKNAGAFVKYVTVGSSAYSVDETDPMMVISKVNQVYDEAHSEVITSISGSGGEFYIENSVSYTDAGEGKTYYGSDLKCGDIISYNRVDKYIKAFNLILDPERDKDKMETKSGYQPWYSNGWATYDQIQANQRVFYAILTRKVGDVISLCDRIENGSNIDECDFRTEIYSVGTTPVYVYKNGRLDHVEAQDLDAYVYEVNPTARIAICTMRGAKRFIIAYDFE